MSSAACFPLSSIAVVPLPAESSPSSAKRPRAATSACARLQVVLQLQRFSSLLSSHFPAIYFLVLIV
jgi:hypothetical protein